MNKRVMLLLSAAALAFCFPAYAETQIAGPDGTENVPESMPGKDPAALLGMTVEEAVGNFGYPDKMYSFRGETRGQDTVVFYYSDHFYLYWFEDRVWQIRFDHRYEETVLGLRFGESRTNDTDKFGPPRYRDGQSLVFELDGREFPIRARFFFLEDALEDIYVYRGDF